MERPPLEWLASDPEHKANSTPDTFLQRYIVTMESGAVLDIRVRGEDYPHGKGLAESTAQEVDGGQIWDSCAGPVDSEVSTQGERVTGVLQFASDIAYVAQFGFRFATRAEFDKHAPQARRDGIRDTPGAWGVYDPDSDCDGWALVSDDPAAIVYETARDLEYAASLNSCPQT